MSEPLQASEKRERSRSCARLQKEGQVHGDTLDIVGGGKRSGVIERAIRQWQTCEQYGHAFPRIATGDGGQRRLEVRFERFSPVPDRCGVRRGRFLKVYEATRSHDGRIRSCGSLSDNLAHEIGHALGLADAPESAYCTQGIMSDVIDDGTRRPRRVTAHECALVAKRWLTAIEREAAADSEAVDNRTFQSHAVCSTLS